MIQDPQVAATALPALLESGQFEQAARILLRAVITRPDETWPLTDAISLGYARNDWNLVNDCARILRERFPDIPAGYSAGAEALRQIGLMAEAYEILIAATGRFPDDTSILVETVWAAQRQGDWPQAARLAECARINIPTNMSGFAVGAHAMREMGQFEEAERILDDAERLFAGEDWPAAERLWVAVQRQDWTQAARQAEALRRQSPSHPVGYMVGSHALRQLLRFDEAEATLLQAPVALRSEEWYLQEDTWIAHSRGDRETALRKADETLARFPANKSSLSIKANILRLQGRFAEAEQVVTGSALSFADDDQLLTELIHIKQASGDLDAAEALLRQLIDLSPMNAWAYETRAIIAQTRGDTAEAERRWREAVRTLPDNRQLALRYAMAPADRNADKDKDWDAALARLEALHQQFPDFVDGWCSHIALLRRAARFDQADRLAGKCIDAMPDEPRVRLEYAANALSRSDLPLFLNRTGEAAARFPDDPAILQQHASALGRTGCHAQAEALFETIVKRFQPTPQLYVAYATLAADRGDWNEAMRRWTQAGNLFPNDYEIRRGLFETQHMRAEHGDPQGSANPVDQTQIMAHFESLGGTGQGCEFGFVQREAGVEPLDLLRWSNMFYEDLLAALQDQFQGVGTPEQTELFFYDQANPDEQQYGTSDKKYGMRMQAFVKKREVAWDDMMKRSCKRLTYLRRKLIEDLQAGEKIFVFKLFERTLTDGQLQTLFSALNAYGPNSLLYVRYEDPAHPTGTVVQVQQRLFVGYIAGFSVAPNGEPRRPDMVSWLKICSEAFRLHSLSNSAG
jgi:tetratricopeptide (TPR) repeat protein